MMFDRTEIKINAKAALKHFYWKAFAVCIIAGILMGETGSRFSVFKKVTSRRHFSAGSYGYAGDYLPAAGIFIAFVFLIIAIIALVISIVYSIFVANIIGVGKCRFFLKSREADVSVGETFSAFGTGRYMNTVGVMLLRNLFVFLWGLLLIVPGIIKHFQYFFVDYIMAEDPSLGYREALDKSTILTDGEKGDIFIFCLSFIGWYFLGGLLFGIGTLFVDPYYEAARAELYVCLKSRKLSKSASY